MTTALIIDDNQLNIETLHVLLRKEGVQTISFQSPQHVESRIQGIDQIDVLFLDLEFPVHNGFQLIHEFRTYDKLKDVPIIAYTVHLGEQAEARQAGFNGFIGKPVNIRKFPNQLQRILAGEPVWEVE